MHRHNTREQERTRAKEHKKRKRKTCKRAERAHCTDKATHVRMNSAMRGGSSLFSVGPSGPTTHCSFFTLVSTHSQSAHRPRPSSMYALDGTDDPLRRVMWPNVQDAPLQIVPVYPRRVVYKKADECCCWHHCERDSSQTTDEVHARVMSCE